MDSGQFGPSFQADDDSTLKNRSRLDLLKEQGMNLRAILVTTASAAGVLALGLGLIFLFSFAAIMLAFLTMAPPPPGVA